ncbi:MAG: hypothetical protein IT197_08785 [Acidimicrobiia bacterium]|nr:hypothetical protein [Acidimicrobiia bacterium]
MTGSRADGSGPRVAAALWAISPELVTALDDRLGLPVDSYVNGAQTWLTDDGPHGETLEWRLHPVAGYQVPHGLTHNDVWEAAVDAARGHAGPGGPRLLAVGDLWDGLECYAAYGDDLEPAVLAARAAERLGRAPDAAGLVDHDAVADRWERTRGAVSIVELLGAQLRS